jgi:hypothetical protein
MPHSTSAPPDLPAARNTCRVVYHPPICPDCQSADVTEADVDTGDGLTETALICRAWGCAWPLACVTDWPAPATPQLAPIRR